MKLEWIVAALAGGTLALSTAQVVDGSGPDRADRLRQDKLERIEERQEELRQARRNGSIEQLRRMQGAWQLVELRSSVLVDAGRHDACLVTVAQEFLTIELHAAYFDDQGNEEWSFIQTGTYRLNFDRQGKLLATLLIGSMDDGEGLTLPREPGEVSVYEVRFDRDSLVLLSDDASRFTFDRIATGALTRLLYEDTEWLPGREPLAAPVDASAPPRGAEGEAPEPAPAGDQGGTTDPR
jgi:hypothetical protein